MLRRIASCLIFTLLAGAGVCAAERVKVQVVQTHTGIKLGPTGVADPNGGADPAPARCGGDSGSDAKEMGFSCHRPPDGAAPATPADHGAYSLFFDVIVIMPDAQRVVFHCSTILDSGCEGFPVYPENTSVVCHDFQFDGTSYKDCTASGSSSAGIGVYQASLHGDRMTIFGPNWERHYLRKGTWEYPDPPALDPKPSPPAVTRVAEVQESKPLPPPETTSAVPQEATTTAAQDPKPAPPQETSPSPAQDSKPAEPQQPKPALPPDSTPPAAQDPKPADPQETKPALPQETTPAAPQDAKPAAPPETKPPTTEATGQESEHAAAAAPAAIADLQLDPTVIEQAKAGNMVAQYKLGYDYYRGRGVALDYVQAAIWWRKAADQGYPDAQNNLGVLYNAGKGVPQSYAEAYFWENLAAARASGNLQVQFTKNRDESASRLWFYERSKVQRRAAKWAAEHPVQPRAQEPREAKQ